MFDIILPWKQHHFEISILGKEKIEGAPGKKAGSTAGLEDNWRRFSEAICCIRDTICPFTSYLLWNSTNMLFFSLVKKKTYNMHPLFSHLLSNAGNAWRRLCLLGISLWQKMSSSLYIWCFTFTCKHRIWWVLIVHPVRHGKFLCIFCTPYTGYASPKCC